MLTDIFLIVALWIVGKELGVIPLILGFCLVHSAQRETGGWFVAWNPKNIKTFFTNWKPL